MATETDIREACYTSPSGKKFYFDYDSKLESETALKTASFTFPERDGALVVPLGVGGRIFSFSCNFYGPECLKKADEFEEGLKERGYGEIIHPLYGVHKVVPTGSISRNDDTVGGLGVSAVRVTFAETIVSKDAVNSEIVTTDNIKKSRLKYEDAAVKEFDRDLKAEKPQESVWASNNYRNGINSISDPLETMVGE